MEGERELTTGLLSKRASFRLIVSGKVGEREIERLIKKWNPTRKFWRTPTLNRMSMMKRPPAKAPLLMAVTSFHGKRCKRHGEALGVRQSNQIIK